MKKIALLFFILSMNLHASESFIINKIHQVELDSPRIKDTIFEVIDENQETFYLSTKELSEILNDKTTKFQLQLRGPGVKVGSGNGDGSGGG